MAKVRIAMVAGEASGDLLAAHLIRALRVHYPDLECVGIGGPRMEAEGFESWWPSERLAVMGLVEVLRRYRELWGIRSDLIKRLKADPPDLFIGIDAPDFNLGLEQRLRKSGIRTAHFVSPSIWAWRGGRVHGIGKAADHVLCLFPFEPELYTRHNIPASFVGHPLADEFPLQPDRDAAREQLQLKQGTCVVTMMPGSRVGEVSRLADDFIEAARLLAERRPDIKFLVPLVTRETRQVFEEAMARRNAGELPIRLLFGHSHEAMIASDVVLLASGTAALEAALLKRPMVVAYRVADMTYRIVKRMVYLPYFSLPNILAGRFVVPEFEQDDVKPAALADAVERWLNDREAVEHLVEGFTEMHLALRQNTAERAAEALLPLIAAGGRH
ncbi:lipid-A-disaccharide synthase [Uliginosibacterium sp. H1]|uniref:lipid-A-disaccharide synthase n=1 Tax=Uliginosibacterium sp. H1 TaxID=3114757 RepID=UPI002E17FEAE|nr:lipid-A-disaccharide synthase [Uliginosibacterium sp. H1]